MCCSLVCFTVVGSANAHIARINCGKASHYAEFILIGLSSDVSANLFGFVVIQLFYMVSKEHEMQFIRCDFYEGYTHKYFVDNNKRK